NKRNESAYWRTDPAPEMAPLPTLVAAPLLRLWLYSWRSDGVATELGRAAKCVARHIEGASTDVAGSRASTKEERNAKAD
ncbi:MAG: hypothetical protein ACKVHP_19545, partial [Verrucomicrobiales bacterium]